MKNLIIICKLLIYLVGGFIILMALDSFSGNQSFFYKIGAFLISCLPGIVIIGITIFLRKKELILGIVILVLALVFFILFKFYIDTLDKLLIISLVILPLVFTGIVFILSRNRYE